MKEYNLICPGCGTVYYSASKDKQKCVKCGAQTVYSGFTKSEFDGKSVSDQQQVINNVKNGLISGPAPKSPTILIIIAVIIAVFMSFEFCGGYHSSVYHSGSFYRWLSGDIVLSPILTALAWVYVVSLCGVIFFAFLQNKKIVHLFSYINFASIIICCFSAFFAGADIGVVLMFFASIAFFIFATRV